MNKTQLLQAIEKLKKAGIDDFVIHCDEGDSFTINGKDCIMNTTDSEFICIMELSRNYTSPHGQFNVQVLPYDNVCHVQAYDLTIEQAQSIATVFGIATDTLNEFIKNNPIRRTMDDSSKFMNTKAPGEVGENGEFKPTLPKGTVGQVTI